MNRALEPLAVPAVAGSIVGQLIGGHAPSSLADVALGLRPDSDTDEQRVRR